MSHDASGGVNGNGLLLLLLLYRLLAHGFRPGTCHVWPGCVSGVGEQSVEQGSSLGRGEDRWCGVGVSGRDSHDEGGQMSWRAGP